MSEYLSVSLVIPVYRGEAHLAKLVERQEELRKHLESSTIPLRVIEAIFVCDEPVDGSASLLASLAESRRWITVLHLAKNLGQHAATAAGMLHTSGDWVVTMDEDGQHDPFGILELARCTLGRSADIAYARAASDVHAQWWRNASSRLAKQLVASLVADPYVKLFNSFRFIRGDIARAAGALASHDLYLDVALRWFTDRVESVTLDLRDPRASGGGSGYTLRSLLAHLRRLIMSYHVRMLHFVTLGGFAIAVTFALLAIATVLVKIFAPERIPVPGWTSTFLAIAFFGGLTLFLLGLVLDRLSNSLSRSQGRPAFFLVNRDRDQLWVRQSEMRAREESA